LAVPNGFPPFEKGLPGKEPDCGAGGKEVDKGASFDGLVEVNGDDDPAGLVLEENGFRPIVEEEPFG